jgi:hypothetical protein
MRNLAEIKKRIAAGLPVSNEERAYLITHDPEALFAFMVENNPGPVNMALRQQGYTHLAFAPNKKALAAQLEIMAINGDSEGLQDVINKWVPKPETLNPSFYSELQKQINTIR